MKSRKDLAIRRKAIPAERRPLDELVRLFVRSYVSEKTKAAYAGDLEAFFTFSKRQGWAFRHPKEIASQHLQAFRDHLIQERRLANGSVIRKMVAVRGLLTWCFHEGIVDRNPVLNVRLPKAKQVLSTLDFSDDEVRAVLALPEQDTASGALHGLVLTLLFYLGLRRGEAISIRMCDFREQRGHHVLRVHGKGEKHRDTPLSPIVRRAIENYILSTGKELESEDYLLQPVRNNYSKVTRKPLHPSTVDWIVKRYARRAGITKRVSPHSCRATTVGNLLENRVPIRDVANLVGHASTAMTSHYDKRKQNLDKSAAYQVRF